MGAYDNSIAVAKRLIAAKGMQCDWIKKQTVLVDPDQPWLGGEDVPTTYRPSIAFLPATDGASGFGITKFRDRGNDTATFSTFGLMAPQAFVPEVIDQLVRDGQPLVIVAVDTLAPAGEPVLHILSIV